eukprot:gene9249-11334_t
MAVQFHVAFSSVVNGAGILAGGPYYCANANVEVALNACMKYPEFINIPELIAATDYAESTLSIDDTANLANSKVWLFSGTSDTVVNQGVVKKLQEYYQHYIQDDTYISTTYNIPAEHSFVTNAYGNKCNYLGPDYINNCNFNSAWEILSFLHGPLNNTLLNVSNNIIQIDQSKFLPFGATTISAALNQYAFAYIPTACQNKNNKGLCSIHIAFHGCEQTVAQIGNTFYTQTGYNEIAETNNIIILYPQALVTILNPKGCFDWFGVTGLDYASKIGLQMATIKIVSSRSLRRNIAPWSGFVDVSQQAKPFGQVVIELFSTC